MSMRKVYRKIARTHCITVAEVKKEIQTAISHAYSNSSENHGNAKVEGWQVPQKDKIPTPEEFIRHIASQLTCDRS